MTFIAKMSGAVWAFSASMCCFTRSSRSQVVALAGSIPRPILKQLRSPVTTNLWAFLCRRFTTLVLQGRELTEHSLSFKYCKWEQHAVYIVSIGQCATNYWVEWQCCREGVDRLIGIPRHSMVSIVPNLLNEDVHIGAADWAACKVLASMVPNTCQDHTMCADMSQRELVRLHGIHADKEPVTHTHITIVCARGPCCTLWTHLVPSLNRCEKLLNILWKLVDHTVAHGFSHGRRRHRRT